MADKKSRRFGEVVHHQPLFISENERIMVTVTKHAKAVDEWIEAVEDRNQFDAYRLVVGFDLKLGAAVTRPVSLLLLCVSPKCLIFDLAHAAQIPPSLSHFLADKDNLFVGVDMQSKLAQLQRDFGFGGAAPNVDLAILTAAEYSRPEMNAAGVSELRAFVLKGDEVERPAVDDIWDGEQLSNEHVRSACIDAYTCYELGDVLVSPELKPIVDEYDLIYPDLDEIADVSFSF